MDITEFLYPRSSYYGQFKPQNLAFNSNLQEFATKVNYIAGLETNGKISPDVAYSKICSLWEELTRSKAQFFNDDSSWGKDGH